VSRDLIADALPSLEARTADDDRIAARLVDDDASLLQTLPADDPTHVAVNEWLSSYVAQPHPDLGRPGPVCPFVEPARVADAISIAAHLFGPEPTVERMSRVLDEGLERFRPFMLDDDKPNLRALIVAFPDLGPEHWHLVDDGHRASKTKFVEQGLMLGQFHPECEAPAAHNTSFPVNRAPLPLMVIRQMASHDILFLEEDPNWVEYYVAWLAGRGIRVGDLLYRRRLADAQRRHAT
jgi:hypothetical protein